MMSSSLTPRKLRAIKLAEDKIISYTIENKIEQTTKYVLGRTCIGRRKRHWKPG